MLPWEGWVWDGTRLHRLGRCLWAAKCSAGKQSASCHCYLPPRPLQNCVPLLTPTRHETSGQDHIFSAWALATGCNYTSIGIGQLHLFYIFPCRCNFINTYPTQQNNACAWLGCGDHARARISSPVSFTMVRKPQLRGGTRTRFPELALTGCCKIPAVSVNGQAHKQSIHHHRHHHSQLALALAS